MTSASVDGAAVTLSPSPFGYTDVEAVFYRSLGRVIFGVVYIFFFFSTVRDFLLQQMVETLSKYAGLIAHAILSSIYISRLREAPLGYFPYQVPLLFGGYVGVCTCVILLKVRERNLVFFII